MADVRSLLRDERASRRINHPHAAYSATGTLRCILCDENIKSETRWGRHVVSASHTSRQRKLAQGNGTIKKGPSEQSKLRKAEQKDDVAVNKKRKADDSDEETADDENRKRPKAAEGLPTNFFDENEGLSPPGPSTQDEEPGAQEQKTNTPILSISQLPSRPAPGPVPTPTVDESEWAAFERDIAEPLPASPQSHPQTTPSAILAEATISAAPLTAAQIEMQKQEELRERDRVKREAEVEENREEVARRIEEDELVMEDLEARVAKLKARRDALRLQQEQAIEAEKGDDKRPEINPKLDGGGGYTEEEEDDDEGLDPLDEWGLT